MRQIIVKVILVLIFFLPSAFIHAEAKISVFCGLGEGHCGKWTNIYENDPKLRAVRVQQFSDSECESVSNLKKCFSKIKYHQAHPGLIIYVFSDCRIRSMHYHYDGKLKEDIWTTFDKNKDAWLVDGVQLKICQ